MSKSLLNAFINIIYPASCLFCSKPLAAEESENLLCQDCYQKIKHNTGIFCKKCGLSLRLDYNQNCPACKNRKFHFDRAWSACIYKEPLVKLIHLFKYNLKLKLKKLFTLIITEFIKDTHLPMQNYDLLLPVPMHPARLRQRDINHSQILTKELKSYFNIPISCGKLIRKHTSRPQTELKFRERLDNVKGAFALKDKDEFKAKNILLVDDVFTTGSTVSEIARVLKEDGASGVDVLTLARTSL